MGRILILLVFSLSVWAGGFKKSEQYTAQGRVIKNQFVLFYKTNNEQRLDLKKLIKSKKYEGLEVKAQLSMKEDCRYDCQLKSFTVIDILPSLQKLP